MTPGARDLAANGWASDGEGAVMRPAAAKHRWMALVLPGGGYHHVAVDKEGRAAAAWLMSHGIPTVVLDYRVAPHRHPAQLEDVRRAVADLRRRRPSNPLLVWGFSAGAHLAGLLAGTAGADRRLRPDRLVLSYPVVSLRRSDGHASSARNLLGEAATDQERDDLSLDRLLGAGSPPTFLMHGGGDRVVPAQQSMRLHRRLQAAGVDTRLALLPGVGHGVGPDPGMGRGRWLDALADWLGVDQKARRSGSGRRGDAAPSAPRGRRISGRPPGAVGG